MNLKKKIAETKNKLKENAPKIACITAAAGAVAYGIYISVKNAPVINENHSQIDEEILPGGYEVVAAITIDDLNKLSENDSYEVSNIDADLFRIKEIKIED